LNGAIAIRAVPQRRRRGNTVCLDLKREESRSWLTSTHRRAMSLRSGRSWPRSRLPGPARHGGNHARRRHIFGCSAGPRQPVSTLRRARGYRRQAKSPSASIVSASRTNCGFSRSGWFAGCGGQCVGVKQVVADDALWRGPAGGPVGRSKAGDRDSCSWRRYCCAPSTLVRAASTRFRPPQVNPQQVL